MIDLHTHSLLSDGALIPSELVRYAVTKCYTGMAITDHVDASNVDFIVPHLIKVCGDLSAVLKIKVLCGVEITHVPPSAISDMAQQARNLGAQIIVVHGETIAEPVAPGTNAAALKSDIDILAHPGFITVQEARWAKVRGIALEISGRKGHSLTNGWVAQIAQKVGASLVFNTDAHAPADLLEWAKAKQVIQGCGLTQRDAAQLLKNSQRLLEKAEKRKNS